MTPHATASRFAVAAMLSLAASAYAQTPVSPAAASCPDCGVIRSIKRVETGDRPALLEERKGPSGLVASIPFDGSKPSLGSSTDLRREQTPSRVSYEVVVRLEDGRLRVVIQDEVGAMKEGDKVKVEMGRAVLRDR